MRLQLSHMQKYIERLSEDQRHRFHERFTKKLHKNRKERDKTEDSDEESGKKRRIDEAGASAKVHKYDDEVIRKVNISQKVQEELQLKVIDKGKFLDEARFGYFVSMSAKEGRMVIEKMDRDLLKQMTELRNEEIKKHQKGKAQTKNAQRAPTSKLDNFSNLQSNKEFKNSENSQMQILKADEKPDQNEEGRSTFQQNANQSNNQQEEQDEDDKREQ